MIDDPRRKPSFTWAGKPVYRCAHCRFERVDNLAAVLRHEEDTHTSVRVSPIAGPDGQQIVVVEG